MNKINVKFRCKSPTCTLRSWYYSRPSRPADFAYHAEFPDRRRLTGIFAMLYYKLSCHTPFFQSQSTIDAYEPGISLHIAPVFEPHIRRT